MLNADGVYDRTKPWNSLPEARLTATLGALAGASAEQIQALRPPLPNTVLFPARFGFEKVEPSVEDCFRQRTQYPTAQNDYTRVQPGYSGSSVQSLGSM